MGILITVCAVAAIGFLLMRSRNERLQYWGGMLLVVAFLGLGCVPWN